MPSGRQRGFTYLALLAAVAALGWGAAWIGETWSVTAQREKEQELLWVGEQYRQAIGLYCQRSPGGAKRYPERLEDLLEDKRHLATQRYLRRIYRDPMTGRSEWGLIRAPEGGIMGVHSLAERAPVRKVNLGVANSKLQNASRISEWRFVYELPAAPAATPAGKTANDQPTRKPAPRP